MLIKLSPKAHIRFIHETATVDICLVSEKNEVQEVRMVFFNSSWFLLFLHFQTAKNNELSISSLRLVYPKE